MYHALVGRKMANSMNTIVIDTFSIWMKWLDRKQQREQLVLFNPETQELNLVKEEMTDIWINTTETLYFFADGSERIIAGSEKSGFNHLYLYEKNAEGNYVETKAITSGEWVVHFGSLAVDEINEQVYFSATKVSAVEPHIFSVSIQQGVNSIICLTEAGFSHSDYTFNSDFSAFACVASNITTAPQVRIYGKNDLGAFLFKSTLNYPFAVPEVPFKPTVPELFQFQNETGNLSYYANMFKARPSMVLFTNHPIITMRTHIL